MPCPRPDSRPTTLGTRPPHPITTPPHHTAHERNERRDRRENAGGSTPAPDPTTTGFQNT